MSTDLSKITTVEAADQAIKETEAAIARAEAAVIEGSPTDVEMLEKRRIELHALKTHRAALAISDPGCGCWGTELAVPKRPSEGAHRRARSKHH